MSGRLTEGFRDILDIRWSEFVHIEQDAGATNFDSAITGLARACKKGNLRAIQTSLDRMDGKIAMEIEVEYPKFYTIYPYATKKTDYPSIIDIEPKILGNIPDLVIVDDIVGSPTDMDELAAMEDEMPTGSLRKMLEKMLNSPKFIVTDILAGADAVDEGIMTIGDPMVKSVIVAGLMKLVHDGKMSAVFEVFDQIDGKVADKIKILGNDVFITRFDQIAPAGAEKNANGVYQLAADDMTNIWATKLEQARLNR
jgi:hypothetical protein